MTSLLGLLYWTSLDGRRLYLCGAVLSSHRARAWAYSDSQIPHLAEVRGYSALYGAVAFEPLS